LSFYTFTFMGVINGYPDFTQSRGWQTLTLA